jgi:hypothetical protein
MRPAPGAQRRVDLVSSRRKRWADRRLVWCSAGAATGREPCLAYGPSTNSRTPELVHRNLDRQTFP